MIKVRLRTKDLAVRIYQAEFVRVSQLLYGRLLWYQHGDVHCILQVEHIRTRCSLENVQQFEISGSLN